MLNRSRKQPAPVHLDEETLRLIADNATVDPAAQEHLAQCATCAQRVADIRQIRQLVQNAALREEVPQHDLAGGALSRLQARHRMGSQVNEVLAGLAAFLQSLAALLSGSTTAPNKTENQAPDRPGPVPQADEEQRHE